MNRREARQAALCMIFDYSFHCDEKPEEQLELYIDNVQDEKEKCPHSNKTLLSTEETKRTP